MTEVLNWLPDLKTPNIAESFLQGQQGALTNRLLGQKAQEGQQSWQDQQAMRGILPQIASATTPDQQTAARLAAANTGSMTNVTNADTMLTGIQNQQATKQQQIAEQVGRIGYAIKATNDPQAKQTLKQMGLAQLKQQGIDTTPFDNIDPDTLANSAIAHSVDTKTQFERANPMPGTVLSPSTVMFKGPNGEMVPGVFNKMTGTYEPSGMQGGQMQVAPQQTVPPTNVQIGPGPGSLPAGAPAPQGGPLTLGPSPGRAPPTTQGDAEAQLQYIEQQQGHAIDPATRQQAMQDLMSGKGINLQGAATAPVAPQSAPATPAAAPVANAAPVAPPAAPGGYQMVTPLADLSPMQKTQRDIADFKSAHPDVKLTDSQQKDWELTGKPPYSLVPPDVTQDGGVGGYSKDALNNAAWRYIQTGTVPPMGNGSTGSAPAVRAAIQNRVAEISKETGVSPQELATVPGQMKANVKSLGAQQQQLDAVTKSVNTFDQNAQMMLNISDQIQRAGSPAIASFELALKNRAFGDPMVAKYLAAQRVAAQEYAKIASGAMGGGGTTDTSRLDAFQTLSTDYNPEQLRDVVQTLHQDGENQKQQYQAQIGATVQRMKELGGSSVPKAGPLVTTQAQFDALPAGAIYTESDGKTYRKPKK